MLEVQTEICQSRLQTKGNRQTYKNRRKNGQEGTLEKKKKMSPQKKQGKPLALSLCGQTAGILLK